MACCCPIVATDVGDVREVIGQCEGCYITSFEPESVAQSLKKALQFAEHTGKTNGRDRILELGLDSITISRKIIEVYKDIIDKYK